MPSAELWVSVGLSWDERVPVELDERQGDGFVEVESLVYFNYRLLSHRASSDGVPIH